MLQRCSEPVPPGTLCGHRRNMASSTGQSSKPIRNGERLSKREFEVLTLLAEGSTSQEMASKMNIGAGTVTAHRHSIRNKLGLYSIAELAKYAIRKGIISR